MSESRWGEARDNTVPIVLVALIIAHFHATASLHGRMADMENRLGDRITRLAERTHEMGQSLAAQIKEAEARLSDRLTRLETLTDAHVDADPGPAEVRRVR